MSNTTMILGESAVKSLSTGLIAGSVVAFMEPSVVVPLFGKDIPIWLLAALVAGSSMAVNETVKDTIIRRLGPSPTVAYNFVEPAIVGASMVALNIAIAGGNYKDVELLKSFLYGAGYGLAGSYAADSILLPYFMKGQQHQNLVHPR